MEPGVGPGPAEGNDPPKKRRGRPRTLTPDEAKRRKREEQRRYKRTSVSLSSAYGAWDVLRKRGKWTHGELALHLLEVHSKFCMLPKCEVSASVKGTIEATVKGKDSVGSSVIEPRVTESKAPVASDSASLKKFVTILPKPIIVQNSRVTVLRRNASPVSEETNKNIGKHFRDEKECSVSDVLETKRDGASLQGHTFVVGYPDEVSSEDHKKPHEEDHGEKGKGEDGEELASSPGEADLKESTAAVDDFLKFGDSLEPDETDLDDGSDSDNKGPENDSDNGEEPGIAIIFDDDDDDEGLKEKRRKLDDQGTDLPFKRFNLAEVAKAEGISDSFRKNRIRKLYWTELNRVYRCSICTSEDSDAYSACRHLLQEHAEVVGDLEEYLIGKPASDTEPDRTLYEVVMEVPSQNYSIVGNNEESEPGHEIKEDRGSAEIKEGGSTSCDSGGKETKDNPLDSMESVKLLSRWVKLQLSCQFCKKAINCLLYTQNGQKAIHRCRLGSAISSLCDICGKSFVNIRQHWLSMHSKPEPRLCPYCGKMKTNQTINLHIVNCHTGKREEHLCGVCKKGFKNKGALDKHRVTHRKDKPFKCEYCQRGFTQSTNMRNHMRQHTGEKPYRCYICPESFAHNVSLKNHLKSKHGIDPWKTDPAGD